VIFWGKYFSSVLKRSILLDLVCKLRTHDDFGQLCIKTHHLIRAVTYFDRIDLVCKHLRF